MNEETNIKGLKALKKLRDLVEYLTRIDYVPSDLRNEVKELLIKSYKDSNGYFSQIKEALKRNEPMKPNYGGSFPNVLFVKDCFIVYGRNIAIIADKD